MSYHFNASHLFLQDNDHLTLLGFADDESAPSQYVLLQKAKEHDEQDRQMGMDKIHIQIEDESRSLYGGIKRISKEGKHLLIELEEKALSALDIDGDIDISVDQQHPQAMAVLAGLRDMVDREGIPFTSN